MSQGEKRSLEPDIIPPSEPRHEARRGTPRARVFFDTRGAERVYIARPGSLSIILVILVTGILSAVLLVLLSAAFLIAVPVVVLLVTAAIIGGLVREYFWPQS
jgi:hypothetical protein